jgi:hypothetical protein
MTPPVSYPAAMAIRTLHLLLLVLAVTGCRTRLRVDDFGAGGSDSSSGGGSANTSTSTIATGGSIPDPPGPGGAGGSGGSAPRPSCDGFEPGTFFMQIETPDATFTITNGCDRFPQFPFALVGGGGECGASTSIAACASTPDVDGMHFVTELVQPGVSEASGMIGPAGVSGTVQFDTFEEPGGFVEGRFDGVTDGAGPTGKPFDVHATFLLCRLPDLPPCP